MLLQIRLSNFFSLRDEAILDFEAINPKNFKSALSVNNVFVEQGSTLLKSIALFGANASGKSNLLKAIDVCLGFIKGSHNYSESTSHLFNPFKFEDFPVPSSFELVIKIDDCKYEYGFSILGNKVIEEHLYSYPKKYKSLVFRRTMEEGNRETYSFSKKFVRPKEIVANTSPYTLFLTRAALMNRFDAMKILKFVSDRIVIGLPKFEDNRFKELLQQHKTTIINALKYADSDIVDYDFKSSVSESDGERLMSYHKGNTNKPFDFDSEESAGTQRLLRLIVAFIDVAENDKILIVDELETSLHPQLVEYAVKIFNKSDKAQLLFSTHDLNLMNIDILRPDQIYFVSKNYNNGVSEIYSLADFKDYKTYKYLKRDYQQGRFDAIPILPIV